MKIICVGRNYAAHAKELNSEVPQEPVLFMKPESAITQAKSYKIPRFTKNLHYETEIVLKSIVLGITFHRARQIHILITLH